MAVVQRRTWLGTDAGTDLAGAMPSQAVVMTKSASPSSPRRSFSSTPPCSIEQPCLLMRAQGASSQRHWLSAGAKRITRLGTGTVTKMGPYLSTSVPGLRRLAAVDATGTRLTSTALPTLHTSLVALRRRLSVRETESLRLPGRPSTLAGSSLRFTLTARLHVGWLCRRVGGPSLPPRKSPEPTASGSPRDVDIAADTKLACMPAAPSWPGRS